MLREARDLNTSYLTLAHLVIAATHQIRRLVLFGGIYFKSLLALKINVFLFFNLMVKEKKKKTMTVKVIVFHHTTNVFLVILHVLADKLEDY